MVSSDQQRFKSELGHESKRWTIRPLGAASDGGRGSEDEVMDGVVAALVSRKLRWMESAEAEALAGAGVGKRTETNSVI